MPMPPIKLSVDKVFGTRLCEQSVIMLDNVRLHFHLVVSVDFTNLLSGWNVLSNILSITISGICSFLFQEGNEVFFRIKNNTQLKKLMTSYCERQSLDAKAIVFLFDGHRIKAEQTPEQVTLFRLVFWVFSMTEYFVYAIEFKCGA